MQGLNGFKASILVASRKFKHLSSKVGRGFVRFVWGWLTVEWVFSRLTEVEPSITLLWRDSLSVVAVDTIPITQYVHWAQFIVTLSAWAALSADCRHDDDAFSVLTAVPYMTWENTELVASFGVIGGKYLLSNELTLKYNCSALKFLKEIWCLGSKDLRPFHEKCSNHLTK